MSQDDFTPILVVISLAALALGIVLAYGVVTIIFRYAFGVYLWNPFGWFI